MSRFKRIGRLSRLSDRGGGGGGDKVHIVKYFSGTSSDSNLPVSGSLIGDLILVVIYDTGVIPATPDGFTSAYSGMIGTDGVRVAYAFSNIDGTFNVPIPAGRDLSRVFAIRNASGVGDVARHADTDPSATSAIPALPSSKVGSWVIATDRYTSFVNLSGTGSLPRFGPVLGGYAALSYGPLTQDGMITAPLAETPINAGASITTANVLAMEILP